MNVKMPCKRSFKHKIQLEKNECPPPLKKRRRMNTEEPLSYFFDTEFPAYTYQAEAASGNSGNDNYDDYEDSMDDYLDELTVLIGCLRK